MKDTTDIGQKAVKYFMSTDRLHHRVVDKCMTGLGLHRSQNMLLMHLSHHNPTPSQRELAEHLNVSPTAVAVKIKKLQTDGYVERTAGADDSRTNTVRITPKGIKKVKQTEDIFKQIDSAMLVGITAEQLKTFMDCMEQMRDNLIKIYNGETEITVNKQGE